MTAGQRGFQLRLAGVAALGLLLRVTHTVAFARDHNSPFVANDSHFFHVMGNLLADGEGYISPFLLERTGEEVATAEHPPLWPLVLAVATKLGGNGELAHRLVGALIGAFVIVGIGLVAQRLAGERAGLAAAGIAAIHPVLLAADASMMSESLYGLGVIASVLAALALAAQPTTGRAALLGALIALTALVRAEALMLFPLLLVPLAWRGAREGRLVRVAVGCLAGIALLTPWTVRNITTFDRPVLISTNAGTVLVGANCERTYSGTDLGFWRVECFSPPTHRNEARQSSVWAEEGLDYAGEHPGELVTVVPVRVLRTFALWQPWRQTLWADGRNRYVERVGTVFYLALVLPLALFGAWRLRHARLPLVVVSAPIAMVVVTSMLAHGETRLRHAADLSLVVLAGVALGAMLERRRAGAPAVEA